MPPSKYRLTFRLKLLLALIGTIAPVLLVTLLIVRREANQQVDLVVQTTSVRAAETFARVEAIRQQQLQQLGWRFSNSNRWGAALQQALEGDTAFLIDQAAYELGLAGLPNALAVFASLSAEPLTGFVNGAPLPDSSAAIPDPVLDRVFAGDTAIFGYHVVENHLYSVHSTVLNLVSNPIGVLLLGVAIDDETARSLGQALGTDVCFFADDRCMANSLGRTNVELERFAASAGEGVVRRIEVDGTPYAMVKQPLPGSAAANTFIALRIPLARIIAPFATIQRAIRIIGLLMLLFAVLVALRLSRGMARPILELVGATQRVAEGDYETTVRVSTRDEIGTLAEAFNDMTHGLLLKERYKGVLDKVVSRDVADEMLKGEIKLGGETRVVTTLFADVRGFTSISEGMEPHSVIALLNEVMEAAEEAVVTEGGVVDKYVGDEIMALFGAPMARGNDTLRALRAAFRIQQAIGCINEARRARAEHEITVGIGINTGIVVAGNMGSARRLNYTVLGAPVNLAARLCSEADGGQVLISDTTLAAVEGRVRTNPLGSRVIKGFSRAINVFEVTDVEMNDATPVAAGGTLASLAALLLCAAPLTAQTVQTSTEADLQFFVPGESPAWLIEETSPFIAGRASLFLDAFSGQRWYGLAELRVDRGETPSDRGIDARIEQLFLRFTPFIEADVALQAGKFVSPFGNYPQRHHSSADPFIRPPLSYDYRTVVSSTLVPLGNDGFLGWKDDPEFFRPVGAPAVWAAPYQVGAMLVGSLHGASFRLAAMNSAPSSEPADWNPDIDQLQRLSWVAHAAYQLIPELRVGISFNTGPYLSEYVQLAPGIGEQYDQQLIGIEGTFTRGFLELRAELLHDTWEVPNVRDDAIDISGYLETKLKLSPGLYAAARLGEMRFNEIARNDGSETPWDYDVRRWQFAAGYRISQTLEVKGELMLNRTSGPIDPADNLFAVQVSFR